MEDCSEGGAEGRGYGGTMTFQANGMVGADSDRGKGRNKDKDKDQKTRTNTKLYIKPIGEL